MHKAWASWALVPAGGPLARAIQSYRDALVLVWPRPFITPSQPTVRSENHVRVGEPASEPERVPGSLQLSSRCPDESGISQPGMRSLRQTQRSQCCFEIMALASEDLAGPFDGIVCFE